LQTEIGELGTSSDFLAHKGDLHTQQCQLINFVSML
jgi:hypothetical protein